jgi:hypothetical protein
MKRSNHLEACVYPMEDRITQGHRNFIQKKDTMSETAYKARQEKLEENFMRPFHAIRNRITNQAVFRELLDMMRNFMIAKRKWLRRHVIDESAPVK